MRLKTLCSLLVVFAAVLHAGVAAAQYTGDRPVRLVIPFTPGSGTDLAARILAEALAESIKRPVVPDNRPGALGTIGTAAVAKSTPDGHTLLMIGGTAISSAPFMMKNLAYDPLKDLAPVYLVATSPLALFVAADSPAKSFQDFVGMAKAQPGKLSYGAHVATNRVAMEVIKQAMGIDLVYVPYKGAPQALNDVAANVIATMFADLSGATPLVRANKVRPLALFQRTRSPRIPDVPTVYELGYTGHEVINWTGVFAPAGTPPALVDSLAREIAAIAARPEIKERYERVGLELRQAGTPQSFAAFVKQDYDAMGPIITALGIQAE